MQPRLSICIATLNRGAFIGETLDTIVPQLRDDVELVIVDGASKDNTGEVVGRYVARLISTPPTHPSGGEFCGRRTTSSTL